MQSRELEISGWQRVIHFNDGASGLEAIVCVHHSGLGPALGGCRVHRYGSFDEGLDDVMRLSRGMTYKNALGGIPFGGGKSVVFADPHKEKTPEMMRAFGAAVATLEGLYIGAADSGITTDDIREMRKATPYVGGIPDAQGRGGNPSPLTAYGVWRGVKAAAAHALGSADLNGLRVAILGLGAVGAGLADYLHKEGATLIVADINDKATQMAAAKYGATIVAPEVAAAQDVDIFAPCALGGAINAETINVLQAKVVAGAANNQLHEPRFDQELHDRGILYAPDYVINAGGVISIGQEMLGEWEHDRLYARLDGLGATLTNIFKRSKQDNKPTGMIADSMAEEIFSNTKACA